MPPGKAYKELIEGWCSILPAQSICLRMPIVWPEKEECSTARTTVPLDENGAEFRAAPAVADKGA